MHAPAPGDSASLPTDDDLRQSVRSLLKANTHEGFSPLLDGHYCYIQPSRSKYWFQWFWDTCFHVFMLCALKEYELAMHNLQSLFAMQEQDGFVGHMIFWKKVLPSRHVDVLQSRPSLRFPRPHMSSLIQPSFVAQALKRIHDETHDEQFLRRMLPSVRRYLDWLAANRDIDGDGLLSIITPFESGMDFKPSFDHLLGFGGGKPSMALFWESAWVDLRNFLHRYRLPAIIRSRVFLVKEVTVNVAYARDLLALARLLETLENHQDALMYRERSRKVTESMKKLMFDEQDLAFYDVESGTNRILKALTPSILFPMLLPGMPEDMFTKAVRRHLLDPQEFLTPYPLPSVAVNQTSFYPDRSLFLWRGPTWAFNNWFLHRGLKERGFLDEADRLLASLKQLIAKSGFREYYHPVTGEGYGEKDFTWSGLVVDMM